MEGESLEIESLATSRRWGLQASRAGRFFIWIAILSAVIIEFSYDLSQEPSLRQIIVGLDTLIVSGLLIKTLLAVIAMPDKWLRRINRARGSLLYAGLCFGFYLWTPRIAGALAIGHV